MPEPAVNWEGPFSPESAQDVNGLLVLGALTHAVAYGGHNFVLRTLRAGEEIAVTLVTKEYADTLGYAKAYAIATVSAALELVDYMPMYEALGPDMSTPIRQKFTTVSQWYWPVVEKLYNEYLVLLERQINAFEELQVKS